MQFNQSILIETIQFTMNTVFVYTVEYQKQINFKKVSFAYKNSSISNNPV